MADFGPVSVGLTTIVSGDFEDNPGKAWGLSGMPAGIPNLIGNDYASIELFEAAWYSANTPGTSDGQTYAAVMGLNGIGDASNWGTTIYTVGYLRATIIATAAFLGMTVLQFMQLSDAQTHLLWPSLPVSPTDYYLFQSYMQNLGDTHGNADFGLQTTVANFVEAPSSLIYIFFGDAATPNPKTVNANELASFGMRKIPPAILSLAGDPMIKPTPKGRK